MSRPVRFGLDYWPCDVDIFDDEKIAPISGEFGSKGEVIIIRLLNAIYRNSYYIEWNEKLRLTLVSKMNGINEGLLKDVVSRLVKWGFFDEDLFVSASVLTSTAIQKRYFAASARRKFIDTDEFLLIDMPSGISAVKSVKVSNNPLSEGDKCDINAVNKRESIDNSNELSIIGSDSGNPEPPNDSIAVFADVTIEPLPETKRPVDARKDEFYDSLIPYVEKYGRQMVRDFFDYWGEISDGGPKMKWEKVRDQKNGTWNLSGRLATWKKHEKKFQSSRERGISMSRAIISVAGTPEQNSEGTGMMKLLKDGR